MAFDYDRFGAAFLASRLHKLRTLITAQSDELFEAHGIEIPSSCVSVMLFIAEKRRASIAKIASATGYSHQLISQRLNLLVSLSLAQSGASAKDKRVRLYSLSPKGKRQATKLAAVMAVAARAFEDLLDELKVDLDDTLQQTAAALMEESILERADKLERQSGGREFRRPAHAV